MKSSAFGVRCRALRIQARTVPQTDLIGVGSDKNGLGKCACKWVDSCCSLLNIV